MSGTTHQAAVVVIPPNALWEPIQTIRRRFDRQFRRWMPHITLLYPFYAPAELDKHLSALSEAAAQSEAFTVRLSRLRHFAHGRRRYTLWLAPKPVAGLIDLQARLQSAAPDCDDVTRFPSGFTPHLSVGQAEGRRQLELRLRSIEAEWRPLEFEVTEVAIIAREQTTPFRVTHRLPLSRGR